MEILVLRHLDAGRPGALFDRIGERHHHHREDLQQFAVAVCRSEPDRVEFFPVDRVRPRSLQLGGAERGHGGGDGAHDERLVGGSARRERGRGTEPGLRIVVPVADHPVPGVPSGQSDGLLAMLAVHREAQRADHVVVLSVEPGQGVVDARPAQQRVVGSGCRPQPAGLLEAAALEQPALHQFLDAVLADRLQGAVPSSGTLQQ